MICRSIAMTLECLQRQADERLVPCTPEAGFAAEFLDQRLKSWPRATGHSTATVAFQRGEAPALAVEGYRLFGHHEDLDEEWLAGWKRGLARLSQRDAFAADRQTFAFRPFELVGIALGVARTQVQREWVIDVLDRLPQDQSLSFRQRVLVELARREVNVPTQNSVTSHTKTSTLGDLALAVVLGARRRGLIQFTGEDAEYGARDALLRRSLTEPVDQLDGVESVALGCGIAEIASEYLDLRLDEAGKLGVQTGAAVTAAVELCERFDVVARQLNRRYNSRSGIEVCDEYDVQDILHALLLSRFRDVRPEEWTPSYAGKTARTDFLLKSEQVFVEAKKTRKGLADREVIEQLTVDVAYYRSHPDCRALVCLVYDPDRRLQNPVAIQNDLSVERDSLAVRVVVCPRE